jgi:lipopolysaccharide transport system ATP-binding protein
LSAHPVIEAADLAKRYTLRHERAARYVALRDVIAERLRRLFRRDLAEPGAAEEFWALDGVSFQVNAGDRVGIIGRNGAGKSTLLKVLSRITEPTRGRVETQGRVASLLEVGTGFHPELTGRENIFLNGAILGMSRHEIARKFDQIVEFAEIERFLDTPVKRYSSGMYVRLAFAVAAYIDPDIMIIDEVLAVGDAKFQKKCLGKMSERAGEGKTILFVSHNMAAVRSLTNRVIMLDAGKIAFDGPTEAGLNHYIASFGAPRVAGAVEFAGRGRHTRIHAARLVDDLGEATLHVDPHKLMRLELDVTTDGSAGISIEAFLFDMAKMPLGLFSMYQLEGSALPQQAGRYVVTCPIKPPPLAGGTYSLDVLTSVVNHSFDHHVPDAVTFEVHNSNPRGLPWDFQQSYGYGAVALLCEEPIQIRTAAERTAA